MFNSLRIQNFRCFDDLSIDLSRINLLSGKNNCGKTAALEAMFILLGGTNLGLTVTLNAFRGIQVLGGEASNIVDTLSRPLFRDFDTNLPVIVSGELDTKETVSLQLRLSGPALQPLSFGNGAEAVPSLSSVSAPPQVLEAEYQSSRGGAVKGTLTVDVNAKAFKVDPVPPPAAINGIFMPASVRPAPQEDAARFGKLEERKEEFEFGLLNTLSALEPRLKKIVTLATAGVPMIYADIGISRLIPLRLMGDGLSRLTSILLAIADARGGVVLIDEVENGFHHSILNKIWIAIDFASRQFGTQIIATTHSLETIRTAHRSVGGQPSDFSLKRLNRRDDTIRIVNYKREDLETAIAEDLEVR